MRNSVFLLSVNKEVINSGVDRIGHVRGNNPIWVHLD